MQVSNYLSITHSHEFVLNSYYYYKTVLNLRPKDQLHCSLVIIVREAIDPEGNVISEEQVWTYILVIF